MSLALERVGSPARQLSRQRALFYATTATAIVCWTAAIVYAARVLVPLDHYLISYYAADYSSGFVRRGLAGELAGPINEQRFFGRATRLRWLTTVIYLVSVTALCRSMIRTGPSERSIQLVLLVPVLSFGVPFAVYSARPDLLGAIAAVALALTVSARPRHAVAASALFGAFTAVTAFIHEAIPFEFALCAVLSIYVLASGLTPQRRRLCAALAMVPGLISAGVIAAFTRHDLADAMCSRIPHRAMPIMTSFPLMKQYMLTGHAPETDYHQWVCGWYLHTFNYTVARGLHEVIGVGAIGLTTSFLLGVTALVTNIAAVQHISGVRFRRFVGELKGRWFAPLLALALMLPIFALGFDWSRWLVIITFNIVTVYLLYVRDKPELERPTSRRNLVAFAVIATLLALVPLGMIPGGAAS